jgi:hypothetical protein
MSMRYTMRVLRANRVWGRVARERLTEPIHLNVASAAVWALGSYTRKIDWDLIYKQPYAYSVLKAARFARYRGVDTVSLLEFGVASGAGLMNMAEIARHVGEELGISFRLYGFDTGKGMPPARDYRDHPEYYQQGDFRMDPDALRANLPASTKLVLGDLKETIPAFLQSLPKGEPIGFVSIDVDYYWSTVEALRVLDGAPEQYMPTTVMYLDDVLFDGHNRWQGELLAIEEFNAAHERRKIELATLLPTQRIFRNPQWFRQIYSLHVLDHPVRSEIRAAATSRHIPNQYLVERGHEDTFQVPVSTEGGAARS